MQTLDERILGDLVNGTLEPGKKLTIKALSVQYAVGPTPLREALSRLEKTQLIEKLDNIGFRVQKLTKNQLIDLQETFCDIECLALSKAIAIKDPKWESDIVACLYPLSKVEALDKKVSYIDWMQLNEAFHHALVSGCQSNELMLLRNQLAIKLKRYTYIAFCLAEDALKLNHNEHALIAQKALEGDKEQACFLMRRHLLDALADLIHFLEANEVFQ